jgi:sec-independent protein translocase protein TatA
MDYLANMANPTVWIVIAVIALLLFGGQKIPEMMRGLGSGMREFKKGMTEDDELRKEREREEEARRKPAP